MDSAKKSPAATGGGGAGVSSRGHRPAVFKSGRIHAQPAENTPSPEKKTDEENQGTYIRNQT
jgi:hypothetical protein